jgi:tetratricopeptide (TPR) repeat protein
MLNRAWQIEEGDPPGTVKEKVESSVEHLIGKKDDVIPYVGSLYALEYPEIEGVDPEFWKTQLYKGIKKILSALAQKAPTVIFLEDLHWADSSSLDLLRFILSDFTDAALFLYLCRPPFSLFSGGQLITLRTSYNQIRLADLSASEARKMAASLLRTKTIPRDLQYFIEEKVEGNPFYLEEVINSLLETETLIRDNGNWKLTRSLRESSISPTIHGVISGRLDRLEKKAKRILQEASVIGRAFFYEILKRITQIETHIDQCLSGLEGLDLIRIKSLQPDLEYIFKHALTQEVVYEGLLKKERQAIHERIGLVMEQLFQDRLPEFYETLAFHFKQGTSILKAVDYLMKSGEKSFRRYAVEESHRYYKEGYDLLANRTDKSKVEECVLIDLIGKWALIYTYYGDFKAELELLRAHQNLAESLDDKERLGMFYAWLGSALHYRAKQKDAYPYLHRALKLGEEIQNQQIICNACSWLMWVCAELGRLDDAIRFGERAQEIAMRLPPDPFLQHVSLSGLGYINWHKGKTKKVFEYGKKLLDHGNKNSDMRSLLWGWWISGLGHFTDGSLPVAIECFKEALQISRDPFYPQIVRVGLGAMYASGGQFQEAEEALQDVVIYGQEHGSEQTGIPAKMYLGAALIGKGRMGQGLRMIEDAQRWYLENEKKSLYAISEYVLGKIYLQIVERTAPMTPSTIAKNIGFLVKNVPFASKKAEYHFNKAIEVAEEIGAKGTLAQAYLDLGRLHNVKSRRDQARACLTSSLELFEEGEAEGFLKQTREALESLR